MEKCPFDLTTLNSRFGAVDAYVDARASFGTAFATDDLGGYVAVVGYDEVRRAAGSPETLCSREGATIPRLGVNQALPTESDNPEHHSYRRLLQPALSPNRVKDWAVRIAEVADASIDDIIEAGRGDLRVLAEQIPAVIIAEILGAPDRSADMVRLTESLHHAAISGGDGAAEARGEFSALIEEIVRGAEGDPEAPGLAGYIVRGEVDGRRVTHQEALSLITTLVIAGQETTVNGIGSMLWLVATHPEVKRRLLADGSLIDRVVEEALRIESPVTMMGRTATQEVELGEVTVPSGARVGLFFGAANLDPERFDDPGVFDIDRDARSHLAFGFGVHRCVGEHLARLEMRVALARVLERIADYEVDGEVRLGNSFPMNRGLLSLPVTFTPGDRAALRENSRTLTK